MSETTFATALDSLGTILPSDPGRDAIHLATYAVTAGERLFPGQHIGVRDGDTLQAFSTAEKLIGIVDPFLVGSVYPGQMFWLVLYPRTITSLRHVWEHPDFSMEAMVAVPPKAVTIDISMSERWLRTFAEDSGLSYGALMKAAENWIQFEDYHTFDHDLTMYVDDEFWRHYIDVTGAKLTDKQKQNFFSCSC